MLFPCNLKSLTDDGVMNVMKNGIGVRDEMGEMCLCVFISFILFYFFFRVK